MSTAGWMPRASSRSSSSAAKSSRSEPSSSVSRLVSGAFSTFARASRSESDSATQPLLRAVVEIPLQAAALARLDLHDPLPRRVDLALVRPCARVMSTPQSRKRSSPSSSITGTLHQATRRGTAVRVSNVFSCSTPGCAIRSRTSSGSSNASQTRRPCTVAARPAGDVLDGAVEADDRPVGVDHAQQARDRVGHRLEEVALGQVSAASAILRSVISRTIMSVSSGACGRDAALVVALLAADRRARTRSSARPRRSRARARSRP